MNVRMQNEVDSEDGLSATLSPSLRRSSTFNLSNGIDAIV